MRLSFKRFLAGNHWLLSLFFFAGFASCEKEVNIDLESSPSQLVVQGSIENGRPPFVVLTNSFGFFSTINLSTFQNVFVHGAHVEVSDGTKTVVLKEYAVDTSGGGRFSVYSCDTSSLPSVLFGELGKSYTLRITVDGKSYSSVTKIPYPKGLDSVWFGEPVFTGPKTPKNALEMFGTYTDPDTIGNYVRYFTQRNQDREYPGAIFTDELVNGKRISNVDLFAGYNDSVGVRLDSVVYFYPGDVVTLKWCEIDKGVYNFWNTYQFAIQSSGNPFASPINVTSNVSNGALGVWAGYGSIYMHFVVK